MTEEQASATLPATEDVTPTAPTAKMASPPRRPRYDAEEASTSHSTQHDELHSADPVIGAPAAPNAYDDHQRYPENGSNLPPIAVASAPSSDRGSPQRSRSRSHRRSSRSPRSSRSRSPRNSMGGRANAPARLYVAGLGNRGEVSEPMVRDLFEQFGKVVAIAPKGPYAFVEFETVEESENAIKKLHNSTQWGGKRLTVEYSNDPRTSRSASHTSDRCYHCGKHGHWARECPDRGGKDVCFKCNRPGHIARECPDNRYSGSGSSRRGGPSYSSAPASYGGGHGSSSRRPPPSSYGSYPPYDPYASRYGDRRVDSGYRSGGYYDAPTARGRSRSPPYASRGVYGAPPASSYSSNYGGGYDDYGRAPQASSYGSGYGGSGYDDRGMPPPPDYGGSYDNSSRGVPPSDYYGAPPHQPRY